MNPMDHAQLREVSHMSCRRIYDAVDDDIVEIIGFCDSQWQLRQKHLFIRLRRV